MKLLCHFIGFACVVMFAQSAVAFILDPCGVAGEARYVPPEPAPNDPIGFKLYVPATVSSQYQYPQYKHYWVKQSVADSRTFVVDLILSNDDTKSFPDYTLVDNDLPYWGFLGPLPSGKYTVLGTVNVYDPATGAISPECGPGTAQRASILYVFPPDDPSFQTVIRVAQAPVLEFYNASLDHYFMTMNTAEIAALSAGTVPGWEATGQRFFAYPLGSGSGLNGVLRYYGLPSAGLNSHFFVFGSEAASLSDAWVLEGVAFEIWQPLSRSGRCPPNTLPVYRLSNARLDTNHRYTIDPRVKQDMIAKGWILDGPGPGGVAMCSPVM